MQEIIAYKPKCCNRAYMSKYSAIRHERKCPNNPDNRACQTCKNRTVDYDCDDGYGWYCEHFEKGIEIGGSVMGYLMEPQMNCEFWEGKEDV